MLSRKRSPLPAGKSSGTTWKIGRDGWRRRARPRPQHRSDNSQSNFPDCRQVWAFDFLREDEIDLRGKPLWERKRALQRLILEADQHILRFSDDFDDPIKLLQVAEHWKLEGIVSKKLHQPYKSGKNLGWVKVKTAAWREANKDRWEPFQR